MWTNGRIPRDCSYKVGIIWRMTVWMDWFKGTITVETETNDWPRCLSKNTGLLHMFFQFLDVGDVISLASWDSNSNMSICDHQEPLKNVGFNGISCCFRKMFTIHLNLAQNYVSTEPQNLPHPQIPHYIPPNPLTCGPWGKWHTHWLGECQVKTYTKTHWLLMPCF